MGITHRRWFWAAGGRRDSGIGDRIAGVKRWLQDGIIYPNRRVFSLGRTGNNHTGPARDKADIFSIAARSIAQVNAILIGVGCVAIGYDSGGESPTRRGIVDRFCGRWGWFGRRW